MIVPRVVHAPSASIRLSLVLISSSAGSSESGCVSPSLWLSEWGRRADMVNQNPNNPAKTCKLISPGTRAL